MTMSMPIFPLAGAALDATSPVGSGERLNLLAFVGVVDPLAAARVVLGGCGVVVVAAGVHYAGVDGVELKCWWLVMLL